MKKYLIIILLFLTFGCSSKSSVSNNLTCLECIHEIVHSSDAYLLDYKDYKTRIERISGDSIIIQAYVINDICDTGSEHAYVTSTLGWFLLLADKLELYNTSADPENPVAVNFDKTILENNSVFLQDCIDLLEKRDITDKKDNLDNLQKQQLTNLPFNFANYYEWQLNIDMGEAENEETYPKNYLEDNKSFQAEYYRYFGKDTIPHFYFMFNTSKQFNVILMVCSAKNQPILFYKIITTSSSKIIGQFTIYTDDTDKLREDFTMRQDLHIIKYLSENIEDEYKIEDDGKILKIE